MINRKSKLFLKVLFFAVVMLSSIAVCIFAIGCDKSDDEKSVVSIEKTHTVNLTDYYTITYSDGSEYVFSVSSGVDGKDGESPTIREIFADYLAENPDMTYEEFLKTYLTANTDSEAVSINKALLSSVKVYAEFIENYYAFPYNQSSRQKSIYSGGGIIYKIEGEYTYIVTNYHVVFNANSAISDLISQNLTCYLYGSEGVPAKTDKKDSYGCAVYDYGAYGINCQFVSGSVNADLALLRAKTADLMAVNEDARAVVLAKSYCVGQSAIAIGNPSDDGISVTKGIISVDNEFISLSIDGVSRNYRSIRIDTPLYSGNSGGGLFNSDGYLIGVCNAGAGEEQNVNFAIPVDIVESVVENLLYYGKQGIKNTKKITLGITVAGENTKYVYSEAFGYGKITEDVKVSDVAVGSIAESIGLKTGDYVTAVKINGEVFVIDRYFHINDVLFKIRESDQIIVLYTREGVEKESEAYSVKSVDLKTID